MLVMSLVAENISAALPHSLWKIQVNALMDIAVAGQENLRSCKVSYNGVYLVEQLKVT